MLAQALALLVAAVLMNPPWGCGRKMRGLSASASPSPFQFPSR